jgi:hypothetical protein
MVDSTNALGNKFKVFVLSEKRRKLSSQDKISLQEQISVTREEPEQLELDKSPFADSDAVTVDEKVLIEQAIQRFTNVIKATQQMQNVLGQKLKDRTVKVNPSADASVRDSIRRVFNIESDGTITYDMFKKCLEWRSQITQEQRKKTYGGK